MLTLKPERIRERLEALDLSENRASELATNNKSRDLVRKILEGKQRGTNYDWTVGIAYALQCSIEYLTGVSETLGPAQPKPTQRELKGGRTLSELLEPRPRSKRRGRTGLVQVTAPDGMASIQEYDVRLSAGHGSLVEDERQPHRTWGIPRDFLAGMRLEPSHVELVSITGDSMEPMLRDGDIVMIDRLSTNPLLPAIYALWEGNATVCKRLEFVRGSEPAKIRVISVNPAYSSYEVLAEEVQVFGRVAWFARRT